MSDPVIRSLRARRVWDSRGRPTVEAEIALSDGAVGRGVAPAGASRGSREAVEQRDGGPRFGGLGVQDALQGIRAEIAPALIGGDAVRSGRYRPKNSSALDGTPTLIEARRQRPDRRFARGAPGRGGEPQGPALALPRRRRASVDSAARNPDFRRRRACRTADRRAGFHDRRAEGRELRRSARDDSGSLPRRRTDHGRARACCKASRTRAAGGRPSRATSRRWTR